jgi:hypothetical protein
LETSEVRRRRTAGQVVMQLPTLQRFGAGERQGTGRGHDGCQREESQHPYWGYFSLERVPTLYVARACVVQPGE